MADRFPLILNTSNNQIQEIASGDNLDLTGSGISNAGIITAGNVTIGAATTDLIVTGDARVTGILTIGTSSLKLDGPNNLVNVGTALTLGHTQGLQFHTQNLHSAGFEVNQVNASGIITATGADINGDLDVDGHTNLDNVNVVGVVTVTGNATVSGNLSVGGVLTYEDVTNVDSVGIVTARNGIKVLAGGANVVGVVTAGSLRITDDGASGPLASIMADDGNPWALQIGNSTYSTSLSTGHQFFVASGGNAFHEVRSSTTSYNDYILRLNNSANTIKNGIKIVGSDQSVILYAGGSETLQTTSTGVSIPLDLDVDGHTNLDNVNVSGVCTVSSNIYTNGRLEIASSQPRIHLVDTDNDDDFSIYNNHGTFLIYDSTNGADRFKIDSSGNITMPGDTTFSGGTGAITIAADSDIRFANSPNWSGNSAAKIQHHNNYLYITTGASGLYIRDENTNNWWVFDTNGHFKPTTDSAIDIGATGTRVRNLYVDDITVTGTVATAGASISNGAGAVTVSAGGDIRMGDGAWTGESAGKIQFHSNRMYIQGGSNGWQLRSPTGGTTIELLTNGNIAGQNLTMGQDVTFNGGAGAVTVASGSDIRMAAGTWTGEHGGKIQYHGDYMYFQVGDTDNSAGWQFRDSTGAATLELKADGTTAGKTITFGQDCQFNGGASAVSIAGGSDIRLSSGGWTGNAYGKIQHHADCLYIGGGSQTTYSIIFRYDGNDKIYMKSDGTWYPATNNVSDLGTTSNRWRNIYTTDLQLSNEGKTNDVDGTWGDYTIQEGESDLFLINNRNGKKYKFNLTEVL